MLTALAVHVSLDPFPAYDDFGTLNISAGGDTGFVSDYISVDGTSRQSDCLSGIYLQRAAGVLAPARMLHMAATRAPDAETAASWLSEDAGLPHGVAKILIQQHLKSLSS